MTPMPNELRNLTKSANNAKDEQKRLKAFEEAKTQALLIKKLYDEAIEKFTTSSKDMAARGYSQTSVFTIEDNNNVGVFWSLEKYFKELGYKIEIDNNEAWYDKDTCEHHPRKQTLIVKW